MKPLNKNQRTYYNKFKAWAFDEMKSKKVVKLDRFENIKKLPKRAVRNALVSWNKNNPSERFGWQAQTDFSKDIIFIQESLEV